MPGLKRTSVRPDVTIVIIRDDLIGKAPRRHTNDDELRNSR